MNAHRAHDATLNVDQHIGNETAETAALGRLPLYLLTTCLMLFAPLFIGTICSTNALSLTTHPLCLVLPDVTCALVWSR